MAIKKRIETTSIGVIDKILTGVAGEYYVAAELSRHGYVASLTSKNTKGIDCLASNQEGSKTVSIQIKTKSKGRGWVLNASCYKHNPNLFYVFVALEDSKVPEYYIVDSAHVSASIKSDYDVWFETSRKDGNEHNVTSIRKFYMTDEEKIAYYNAWNLLGL